MGKGIRALLAGAAACMIPHVVAAQDNVIGLNAALLEPQTVFRGHNLEDGITIDFLWCAGDGSESARLIQAIAYASGYSTMARVQYGASNPVKEIRVRPVDIGTMKETLSPFELATVEMAVSAKLNYHDARLSEFAQKVKPFPDIVNMYSDVGVDNKIYSPNYMAIYICKSSALTDLSGRVYIQIDDPAGKAAAIKLADAMRTDYSNVVVADGIEVVKHFPKQSEVRYFFVEDEALAKIVADKIGLATGIQATPRIIAGYEDKVRSGTIEAWMKGLPPK